MCTRYTSPDQAAIERFWHIGRHNQSRWVAHVFPRAQGPFLRASRMHRPDLKLAPDRQHKRSVVAIEFGDVDAWLRGLIDDAAGLMRPPPVELIDCGVSDNP